MRVVVAIVRPRGRLETPPPPVMTGLVGSLTPPVAPALVMLVLVLVTGRGRVGSTTACLLTGATAGAAWGAAGEAALRGCAGAFTPPPRPEAELRLKDCGGRLTETSRGLLGRFFSRHSSQLDSSGSVLSPRVSSCW